MRIGILDDDEVWQKILYKHILNLSIKLNMNIEIEVYRNYNELKDYPKKIDILLLDIDMPEFSGIEIKESLPKYVSRIIFVTNYDKYMLRAFGDKVYGFVKKDQLELLDEYIQKIYELGSYANKILVNNEYIDLESIYYLKSDNIYTIICCPDEIMIRKGLSEFENELRKDIFVRVHRSYIINFQHVVSISCKGIVLDNNMCIKIRRGYVKEIKRKYIEYMLGSQ